MRESAQAGFYRYPQLEAIRMLVELLDEPDRYNHALESFVSRVTCHLAWGHSEASDELKQRARELLISVSPTGALGNKLPFLMSLPAWLSPPKAWELRRAATEARWFSMMRDQVQADVRENRAPQSWMKTFLENPGRWGLTDTEKEPQWWKTISEQPRGWSPGFDEKAPSWTSVLRAISSKLRFIANDKDVSGGDEAAYCVGMHGIAGALTIAAPMQTFCLALAFHPQFLPPLHQEMDRVCGGRLPRSEDRPRLPFLRAVIRECLRWRPPVPTGIPHYLTQDDEYNGFHIPKGSVIHPLEWAISRDPKQFPYPEAFNPRRWIDPGYPTYQEPLTEYPTILNSTQFGYGQRKCQGQNVADEDLFIGLGSLVWLFNISRLEDNNITQSTNPKIDPTLDYSTLLIAKPLPFKFSLTPRDAWREAKVRALYAELAAKGEFPQSAEYWGEEFGKGKKYGWGKV
ncbi:cytochrome P450 [Sporormia fimetaria CBS 119925]|uniref:Cytochrome P450 n=1 Tax=Sporormia fimetaria CBS 119925 TaxID=1340428 RepID=A0A6A6VQH1_9PLEO|nr:cytochrome P450 [Sporormia fimetaria CBS 119925]